MRTIINVRGLVSLLLTGAMLLNLVGCGLRPDESGVSGGGSVTQGIDQTGGESASPGSDQTGGAPVARAADLMEGITAGTVAGKTADDKFVGAVADFAVKLFQNRTLAENEPEGENVLISPLSVLLALAMTANGAAGETLTQMEELLGGGMSIAELNEYLYTYAQSLPGGEKAKLNIANSIWFRDSESLRVEQDFLQTNADYYGATARKSAFNEQTKNEINSWVRENTDGMIEEIISGDIPISAVMYLINAIVFDAEWATHYSLEDISDGFFTTADGTKQTVSMMWSEENSYLEGRNAAGGAVGFVKAYAGGDYSFAAILPNPGVDINAYMAAMTGENLLDLLDSAENTKVIARMPKFSYEDETLMNNELKALGIPDAFDSYKADFSGLGKSSNGNIYIGEVLHKTFIAVDELGTKAGAVTSVRMDEECADDPSKIHYVTLDRPFIYMIIDNATDLPVFMGAVMDIQK